MVVLYLALGIAGVALGLVGFMEQIYPLVAVGAVLIFAAFFWFVRTNQRTPAPAGPEGSRLHH